MGGVKLFTSEAPRRLRKLAPLDSQLYILTLEKSRQLSNRESQSNIPILLGLFCPTRMDAGASQKANAF